MDTVASLLGGGTDLTYHMGENKLNLNANVMDKNSSKVKKVVSSGIKSTSKSYVNIEQCLGTNDSRVGTRFTVPLNEGFAGDSPQDLSSHFSSSFVQDQAQSCSNQSKDSNHKYDQVSSTYGKEVVPMAQGTNPSVIHYQKALHNIDNSRVTSVKVNFTNISLYCPVQNTLSIVVFLHNVQPNKGGVFCYYVQHMDATNMYYFTNCHKVPDGELSVLFSMELLFSVSILHDLCTYEKEVSKAVNTVPIEAYNDFMKDMNTWNRYKLSYNDYMTNIINEHSK